MTVPIAVDTDPGVDDALALMLALRSPEISVELVTTVAGNVPVGVATANAGRLLALVDPPAWPMVARGAGRPLRRKLNTAVDVHGEDGLGGAATRYPVPDGWRVGTRAPERLVEFVARHGKACQLVALGPLTNVARAVEAAPEVMATCGGLVIMGGAVRAPGNVTPVAEFNVFVDPEAADIVLASGMAITLVPLDVTHRVFLSRERLAAAGNAKLARAVKAFTRTLCRTRGGLYVHDPLAVAVALRPHLVSTERLALRVETAGTLTAGMTIADLRGAEERAAPGTVDVATSVDAGAVLDLLEERVLRAPRRSRPAPRPRVVVVGSANVDLSVEVDALPRAGETVLGPSLEQSFGGKGANQAVAARRAGSPVSFLGRVGDDAFGRDYARFLAGEGIDTEALGHDPGAPTGVGLIVVGANGENQIAVASGANARLTPAGLGGLERILADAAVAVLQLEIPLETVTACLREARRAGVRTLLNSAPAAHLPGDVLALVDLLVANEVEASLLAGRPAGTPAQAARAARALLGLGPRTVAITLGAKGVVLASSGERETRHFAAPRVRAVDTTGAGDTFVGYLASALARGAALPEAVETAMRAAALCVTKRGAVSAIPRAADLH